MVLSKKAENLNIEVSVAHRALADVDTLAATEAVINYMKRTTSNASFVLSAKKSFSVDS